VKISIRSEWPFWALLAAMFVASAIAWPMVPERFPLHYDLYGKVDHWGTRPEAAIPLLILPAVSVVMYLFLLVLPLIDPGRANYNRFGVVYWVIRFVVLANFAVLHAVVLVSTLGHVVDVARIMLLSAGVMLLVMGSVMGKVRPNWFVGVRTPWTLSSKLSWTHSQRAGGWMFIVVGLLTLPAAFLPAPWNIAVFLGALILGPLGLVVYSYLVWRRDTDRVPPTGTTPADE
jgi:uncharacterized membrane protein